MSYLNETDRQRPSTLVVFHGLNHQVLNLQSVTQVRENLIKYLNVAQGRKIVYLESADTTPEKFRLTQERGGIYGGLGNVVLGASLSRLLKRHPSPLEVATYALEITTADVDRILDEGIISEHSLTLYYKYKMIDNVKASYGIEIQTETHPENFVRRTTDLVGSYMNIQAECFPLWQRGRFNQVVDNWRKYFKLQSQASLLRDPALVDELEPKVLSLVEGGGGLLFLPFGAAHEPMMETLQQKIGEISTVQFITERFSPENNIDLEILISLKNEQPVSNEMYAQDFFQRLLTQKLYEYFRARHQVANFAYNFESIYGVLGKMAKELSLKELRLICTKRADLLQLIRQHPSSSLIPSFSEL